MRIKSEIGNRPLACKSTSLVLAVLHIVFVALNVQAEGIHLRFPQNESCGLVTVCHPPKVVNGFTHWVQIDFVFDQKLDQSLFSIDPPAGYQVKESRVDVS